jgi:hypothetical protein
MHIENDTQTVANTLALYGVTRRRTPWRYIAYTLAGVAVFNVAYLAGTVLKAALGW